MFRLALAFIAAWVVGYCLKSRGVSPSGALDGRPPPKLPQHFEAFAEHAVWACKSLSLSRAVSIETTLRPRRVLRGLHRISCFCRQARKYSLVVSRAWVRETQMEQQMAKEMKAALYWVYVHMVIGFRVSLVILLVVRWEKGMNPAGNPCIISKRW